MAAHLVSPSSSLRASPADTFGRIPMELQAEFPLSAPNARRFHGRLHYGARGIFRGKISLAFPRERSSPLRADARRHALRVIERNAFR